MRNAVERSARLTRRKPREEGKPANEHFDGFRFQVPTVALGDPKSCSISVPGPFFVKTFVAPNTPYDSLRHKQITFHSAPDAGFGLLLMNNTKARTALASFMSTGGEVAYRSGSAAPELMRAMLTAMRQKKPDAVLLSEVFGPVFYSVCNFAHDNQTEAITLLLEKMAKGQYTAADYKTHLMNVFAALPVGANRVFYARNHDTDWFYHFDGYTPRFMAFEAVHALFGIREAFAGDPDHKYNPDDDPRTYAQYKSLFALRKRTPAFVRGAMRLHEVTCTNRMVFIGLRGTGANPSLALISFSDKPETMRIMLPQAVGNGKVTTLQNIYGGEGVTLKSLGKGVYEVTLKPFGAVAGVL